MLDYLMNIFNIKIPINTDSQNRVDFNDAKGINCLYKLSSRDTYKKNSMLLNVNNLINEPLKDEYYVNLSTIERNFVLYGRKKMSTVYDLFHSYLITHDVIGEGITGNIIKCTNKNTGTTYALKILDRNPSSYREVYIQNYLTSQYIINLVDVFYDDTKIYAIMELANGGDVFDHLCEKKLTETNIMYLIYNISLLLNFIHGKGVIHGDIKLENVLISNNKLKLCDFGFSVFESRNRVKRYAYTLPYTAPEHLNEMRYSFKSDVWSLGIIAFYFFFNKFPFGYIDGMSKNDVQKCFATQQLRFPLCRKISPFFKSILISMLHYNEDIRIDIPSLINLLESKLIVKKLKM